MKEPSILYEDNHLLAVNKPAGWLVQGDKTGDTTLLDWAKLYIKEKYQKPGAVFLGCVHRIDRPVCGVVVFARTSKALSRMNALFSKGAVNKSYLALVEGKVMPPNGRLEHILAKDEHRNMSYVVKNQSGIGKLCLLDYKVLVEHERGRTVLIVNPLTGRPHQIRVQLSATGWPILGDVKYGAAQALPDASIALQCLEMEFVHPVTQAPLIIRCEALPIFGAPAIGSFSE